jgi:hypothetical protein
MPDKKKGGHGCGCGCGGGGKKMKAAIESAIGAMKTPNPYKFQK